MNLASTAVDARTGFLHVSQSGLSDELGIPERTLARRKGEGVLNSEESASKIEIGDTQKFVTDLRLLRK